MRVSVNSWHYRLLDFYHFEHPPNLCGYFWKVVASVIFTPFILIGIGIADLIMAWEMRHAPKPPKTYSNSTIMWMRIIGFVGFFVYGIVVMIYFHTQWYWAFAGFFIYTGMQISHYIKFENRHEPEPKKKKEPNIAIEYLKAKKQRYCPLIEFINPEEEQSLR